MASRAHLTEAEKEVERAKARHYAYLKHLGQGGFVDAKAMQERIRKLHDVHQISFRRISDKTGVDVNSVKYHYRGEAANRPGIPLVECRWATANVILTTPFGPADVRAQVLAHGTQRRLRALIAAGYSQAWLSAATGRSLTHMNAFLVRGGGSVEVSSEHATMVEQVYRKYIDTDPVTVGLTPRAVTYSKTVARKRGYEPGSCWDDDTIDDPNAIPEWTGACGTSEGFEIHGREGIPMCPPCAKAGESVAPCAFSPTKLRIRMDEVGSTPELLAAAMGVHIDSIYRWRQGARAPRGNAVQAMATALDCSTDALMDGDAPVLDQDFRREVFAGALEERGMSAPRLAIEMGVSVTAVQYWCNGTNIPKIPKIVKAAGILGVDWKVFYE